MVMNKLLLVLGIILFHQAAVTLAQSEPVLCSVAFPGDPSPQNICTLEWRPVCAYTFLCIGEDECEGTTVGNACGACSQEGYDYYYDGACDGDEEENGEDPELPPGAIWCNIEGEPDPNAICTLEYNPVCAYNIVGSGGTTAGNPCQACYQLGFAYYFPGECEDDTEGTPEEGSSGENTEEDDQILWCPVPAPEVCTLQYDPVCAYSATEEGASDGVTVGNWCQACLEGYDFYTKGACDNNGEEEYCPEEGGHEEGEVCPEEGWSEEGEGTHEIIWCTIPDLSATDVVCTLQFDPVCAYRAGEENSEGTTVGNACQACLQQGFDYYTKGACQEQEEEETAEEIIIIIDPEEETVEEIIITIEPDENV